MMWGWSCVRQGGVRLLKHFGGCSSTKLMMGPMPRGCRRNRFILGGRLFEHCYATASTSDSSNRCTSAVPMYFTCSAIDGVGMDPKEALTLESLFNDDALTCFDNLQSTIGAHDFSILAKKIFEKLLTIAYQQAVERDRYLHFDPSHILVSVLRHTVLEVGISTSQVVSNEATTIYKDRIVGPFARMVLSLCLKAMDTDPLTGEPRAEHCYKEVLDLLFRAQKGEWWESLGDLLAHPLFQSLEKKMCYIVCTHQWMSYSKFGDHGVSTFTALNKTKINGSDIELSYDPMCGMSKEEHGWHCDQTEKIYQRVPEALHKLRAESEKVRHHFRDDPVALEIWDEYIDDIHLAASRNLTYSLSSYAQKSALYEKLMLSKARSNTCAHMLSGGYDVGMLSRGYEKLKRTTNKKMVLIAGVAGAVGVAAGVAVGPFLSKDQETKEN